MDIGKALTFVTEDPKWQEKLLIGTGVLIVSSLLSVILVGILGFLIVMGYSIRLLQNVRDNDPTPLPEWDQWGDDLMRGFKLAVVAFVWALPAIIFVIPTAVGGALVEGRGAAEFVGSTLIFCGSCLTVLYSLMVVAASPGFYIAFASDEQISTGLQFRSILEWTWANIGQVLLVAIVYLVASFAISLVASIVGTLLCVIGLIVTIPLGALITYLFQGHLYGQLAGTYPMDETAGSTMAGPPAAPPVASTEGVMTSTTLATTEPAATEPDEPVIDESASVEPDDETTDEETPPAA